VKASGSLARSRIPNFHYEPEPAPKIAKRAAAKRKAATKAKAQAKAKAPEPAAEDEDEELGSEDSGVLESDEPPKKAPGKRKVVIEEPGPSASAKRSRKAPIPQRNFSRETVEEDTPIDPELLPEVRDKVRRGLSFAKDGR